MKTLKPGRASIKTCEDSLFISIPARKNIILIIFLIPWLVGWLYGEVAVLTMLLFTQTPGGIGIFIWLIFWTAGGLCFLYILIWNLTGEEVVTITSSSIRLEKVVFGRIRRGKEYSLNNVRNFRIAYPTNFGSVDWNMEWWGLSGGFIEFDYCMEEKRFAMGIDDEEAGYLLEYINKFIRGRCC